MKIDKITGSVVITKGKINLAKTLLSNEGNVIQTDIEKLLAIRDVIQEGLLQHERDVQNSFIPVTKTESKQIDLLDSINEIENQQK